VPVAAPTKTKVSEPRRPAPAGGRAARSSSASGTVAPTTAHGTSNGRSGAASSRRAGAEPAPRRSTRSTPVGRAETVVRARRPSRPSDAADGARPGRRRGRVPWGTISRELIVDAATEVVRAGRYEEMSIRSLAAELGVAPMSLYRHVRDKDDLLDEVVDRLLRRVWRPRGKEDDWVAWLTEASERLRRFLVAQPAALRVYLRHPMVTPTALARMEAMIGVLRGAGLDESAARRAYAALQTYTIGFAALEASRDRYTAREATDGNEIVAELLSYTSPAQFLEGLDYLLEAIAHRTTRGRRRERASQS
jgi:AcrR family transcriptional regulator